MEKCTVCNLEIPDWVYRHHNKMCMNCACADWNRNRTYRCMSCDKQFTEQHMHNTHIYCNQCYNNIINSFDNDFDNNDINTKQCRKCGKQFPIAQSFKYHIYCRKCYLSKVKDKINNN